MGCFFPVAGSSSWAWMWMLSSISGETSRDRTPGAIANSRRAMRPSCKLRVGTASAAAAAAAAAGFQNTFPLTECKPDQVVRLRSIILYRPCRMDCAIDTAKGLFPVMYQVAVVVIVSIGRIGKNEIKRFRNEHLPGPWIGGAVVHRHIRLQHGQVNGIGVRHRVVVFLVKVALLGDRQDGVIKVAIRP